MDNNGLYVATEVFADVLAGAKVIKVDPNACIPFIHVRKVVHSGVQRIKYSFSNCEEEDNSLATGAICGGSLPTLVELSGPFEHYVVDFFMQEHKLSRPEAETKATSRNVWYGIVDGTHRLLALIELQQDTPQRWAGFKWSVLLLQGVQSLKTLRAFARAQNLRQSNEKYIETTLYDLFSGLQEEARRLGAEFGGRRPSSKEVAERYSSSSDRTSRAMRTLAGISLKLSSKVVSVMGEIMNYECPRLACSYYSIKERRTYEETNIQEQVDCRVYRSFLTMTSLRQATSFLNASGDNVEELQINALYRLRDCCRNSGFKPVVSGMVMEQYARAASALREALKFEKLLCSKVWPRGMEKLQENLLRTTVLDDDVEDNQGNDVDILPVIIQEFRRCVPGKFSLMEARYFSTLLSQTEKSCGTAQGKSQGPVEVADDDQRGTMEPLSLETERPPLTQQLSESPSHVDDDHEVLQKFGITCFEMDWRQYNRTLHSNSDALYDLILTEPPRGVEANKGKARRGVDETLEQKELKDFAQFARRVLAPGGYILLFTAVSYFRDWVSALRSMDFQCVQYPFVVTKDTRGMQRENRVHFPQSVCDFIVMGISPGKNSKGFEAAFGEAYKLLSCSYKRKFAAIDGVPTVPKKLRYEGCRSIVCTSEKNPDPLSELMVTFSPPGGIVLDPYAGTMSLGIACLGTARHCTLIEKDPECFKLAFLRLVGIAKSHDMSNKAHFVPPTPISSEDSMGRSEEDCVISNSDEIGKHVGIDNMMSNADSDVVQAEEDPLEKYLAEESGNGNKVSSPSYNISSVAETSEQEDARVELLKDGIVVARACIANDETDKTCFRTLLHGTELSTFEKDDERLVVVWKVTVLDMFKNEQYPYTYGGPDGPIEKLSQMRNGFHAWDLNAMKF